MRDQAGRRVPFKTAERALLAAYHGHAFTDSAPLREILLMRMPSFRGDLAILRLSGLHLYHAVVAQARQAKGAKGAPRECRASGLPFRGREEP